VPAHLTMAHSTASSILASSKMMRQLLPPSSMHVGMPLLAASPMMRRPVAVLPVKLILAKPGLMLHAIELIMHQAKLSHTSTASHKTSQG
jgi:hypothetical protein